MTKNFVYANLTLPCIFLLFFVLSNCLFEIIKKEKEKIKIDRTKLKMHSRVGWSPLQSGTRSLFFSRIACYWLKIINFPSLPPTVLHSFHFHIRFFTFFTFYFHLFQSNQPPHPAQGVPTWFRLILIFQYCAYLHNLLPHHNCRPSYLRWQDLPNHLFEYF